MWLNPAGIGVADAPDATNRVATLAGHALARHVRSIARGQLPPRQRLESRVFPRGRPWFAQRTGVSIGRTADENRRSETAIGVAAIASLPPVRPPQGVVWLSATTQKRLWGLRADLPRSSRERRAAGDPPGTRRSGWWVWRRGEAVPLPLVL